MFTYQKNYPSLQLLIVEDNPVARQGAEMRLASVQPGSIITVADHVAQAITYCRIYPYDGILLDLDLPDQDGTTVIDACRQSPASKNKHTPIAILSAHVNDQIGANCLKMGANRVWVKPLTTDKARVFFDTIMKNSKK